MAESSVKNREVEYISEPCLNTTSSGLYGKKSNVHIKAAKYGKIIMLMCDGAPDKIDEVNHYPTAPKAGWTTIATLKSEICPAASYQPVYITGVDNNAGTQASSTALNMRIISNGEIQVYFFSDKLALGPRFSVAYLSI